MKLLETIHTDSMWGLHVGGLHDEWDSVISRWIIQSLLPACIVDIRASFRSTSERTDHACMRRESDGSGKRVRRALYPQSLIACSKCSMSHQNFNICGLVDCDELIGADDDDREHMPMTTIQEFEAGIVPFKNDGTYLGVMSQESSEVCWGIV